MPGIYSRCSRAGNLRERRPSPGAIAPAGCADQDIVAGIVAAPVTILEGRKSANTWRAALTMILVSAGSTLISAEAPLNDKITDCQRHDIGTPQPHSHHDTHRDCLPVQALRFKALCQIWNQQHVGKLHLGMKRRFP